MQRNILAVAGASLLAATLLVGCGGNDGDDNGSTMHGPGNGGPAVEVLTPQVAADVAAMRAATARYANDLDAAVADGFFMITPHMAGQGVHYLNPAWWAEGFDPSEPPILMFVETDSGWQLVGFEWVFPAEPEAAPMDGATYGSFVAACHYEDGEFVPTEAEADCAETHPDSGAGFTFWHPDLVTLHVWGWMHNPDGIYSPRNPMMG
jgi:hypothetical protein